MLCHAISVLDIQQWKSWSLRGLLVCIILNVQERVVLHIINMHICPVFATGIQMYHLLNSNPEQLLGMTCMAMHHSAGMLPSESA